jgi:hypothetical protein
LQYLGRWEVPGANGLNLRVRVQCLNVEFDGWKQIRMN